MNKRRSLPTPAGIALGLLFLWGSMRLRRKRRLIDDLPRPRPRGCSSVGGTLKGTRRSLAPSHRLPRGQRCVHLCLRVEERWSRTVTRTYRDSKGEGPRPHETSERVDTPWPMAVKRRILSAGRHRHRADPTGWRETRPQRSSDRSAIAVTRLTTPKVRCDAVADFRSSRSFCGDRDRFACAALCRRSGARPAGRCRGPRKIAADKELDVPHFRRAPRRKVRAGLGGLWRSCCSGSWRFPPDLRFATAAAHQPFAECWPQYAGLAAGYLRADKRSAGCGWHSTASSAPAKPCAIPPVVDRFAAQTPV